MRTTVKWHFDKSQRANLACRLQSRESGTEPHIVKNMHCDTTGEKRPAMGYAQKFFQTFRADMPVRERPRRDHCAVNAIFNRQGPGQP